MKKYLALGKYNIKKVIIKFDLKIRKKNKKSAIFELNYFHLKTLAQF